jgi:hypothetical protein
METTIYRTLNEELESLDSVRAYHTVKQMKEKGLNPISMDEALFQRMKFGIIIGTPVMINEKKYLPLVD